MKKLNNKGFTLVELLAVIIILAVVVGISIPAVMSTVSNAKVKAFQTAANTCADWIERQYQVYAVDPTDIGLNATLKTSNAFAKALTSPIAEAMNDSIVTACGLKTTNVDGDNSKFYVNSSGRVCVLLSAATNGDYDGTGTVEADGKTKAEKTDYAVGGACDGTEFSSKSSESSESSGD